MFVSEESLGFGSLMELSIAVQGRVLKTDGRVVYEIRKSPTEHQVGVEFLRITPADRAFLESFVGSERRAPRRGAQLRPLPPSLNRAAHAPTVRTLTAYFPSPRSVIR